MNTPRSFSVFRMDVRAWRRRGCRDDGVGLAAPQVGVNVRLMVFNAEGLRGSGEELLLANPRIVTNGKGQDVDQVNVSPPPPPPREHTMNARSSALGLIARSASGH